MLPLVIVGTVAAAPASVETLAFEFMGDHWFRLDFHAATTGSFMVVTTLEHANPSGTNYSWGGYDGYLERYVGPSLDTGLFIAVARGTCGGNLSLSSPAGQATYEPAICNMAQATPHLATQRTFPIPNPGSYRLAVARAGDFLQHASVSVLFEGAITSASIQHGGAAYLVPLERFEGGTSLVVRSDATVLAAHEAYTDMTAHSNVTGAFWLDAHPPLTALAIDGPESYVGQPVYFLLDRPPGDWRFRAPLNAAAEPGAMLVAFVADIPSFD